MRFAQSYNRHADLPHGFLGGLQIAARVELAGLFREDLPDRWDLMISAPWASADRNGAIDYLVARIKADIEPNALVQLSRIIIIDPEEASMQKLNRTIRVDHGAVEVRDTEFFGVPIKHAYIITSKLASPALAG
jgi:hypothetical protein